MKGNSTALVLAAGMACITMSVLLACHALGLLGDPFAMSANAAADLCQATGAQVLPLIETRRYADLQQTFTHLSLSGTALQSAAFRDTSGDIVAASPSHERRWTSSSASPTVKAITIPVIVGDRSLGSLELLVDPSPPGWAISSLRLVICIVSACLMGFLLFTKRILRYLDPSSVISDRVRTMLNTLAEGVLVIDNSGRIVMVNDAFSTISQQPIQRLPGRPISELPWSVSGDPPWTRALQSRQNLHDEAMAIEPDGSPRRSLKVNCSLIRGQGETIRGLLVTVDDITHIEQKNIELQHANEQIERQNRELQLLATTDPLTGCMNRRSFFGIAETKWNHAQRYHEGLSCIMLDIDHFKKINDGHGHAMGDKVLTEVGSLLRKHAREGDLVCRYGGEEFCVLLQNATLDDAAMAAERFRQAIEQAHCGGLDVTISLGAAKADPTTANVGQMLEHADTALYSSKHTGRNRVTRYDQLPPEDKQRAAA
jgi:diguanylate cyclase (GGDEF)-like protein/PAS domain S-box-containing protein